MRTLVSAPYPCPGGFPSMPKASLVRPLFRSFRDLFPGMNPAEVRLHSFDGRQVEPLSQDDLPLIVITHNDMKLIQPFLAHYGRLGVTRFLCVDDVSGDGTREFLIGQPDVDLYTSNVRYKLAYRGRLWRQMLVARYSAGRWYVFVDPDEFLVYCGHETVTLPHLIKALAHPGVLHCPAPFTRALMSQDSPSRSTGQDRCGVSNGLQNPFQKAGGAPNLAYTPTYFGNLRRR